MCTIWCVQSYPGITNARRDSRSGSRTAGPLSNRSSDANRRRCIVSPLECRTHTRIRGKTRTAASYKGIQLFALKNVRRRIFDIHIYKGEHARASNVDRQVDHHTRNSKLGTIFGETLVPCSGPVVQKAEGMAMMLREIHGREKQRRTAGAPWIIQVPTAVKCPATAIGQSEARPNIAAARPKGRHKNTRHGFKFSGGGSLQASRNADNSNIVQLSKLG